MSYRRSIMPQRSLRRLALLATLPLRLIAGFLVAPVSPRLAAPVRGHWRARQCPAEATKSIHELTRFLVTPFEGDELAIAEAIASWVYRSVQYDYETYRGTAARSQAPEDVLRDRLGICAGISALTVKLMRHGGLDAVTITGLAKLGAGKAEEHMWLACRINGIYELYDVTWGEFRISPRRSIRTKYPEHNAWQLISPIIPFREFCGR
jgi:hypothetical protein